MNCSRPNSCSQGCTCNNNPFAEVLAERGLVCSRALQEIYHLLKETVPSVTQQQQLALLFNILQDPFPPPQGWEFNYGRCYTFVEIVLEGGGDPQDIDVLRTCADDSYYMVYWCLHKLFRERALKYGRLT